MMNGSYLEQSKAKQAGGVRDNCWGGGRGRGGRDVTAEAERACLDLSLKEFNQVDIILCQPAYRMPRTSLELLLPHPPTTRLDETRRISPEKMRW